MSVAAMTAVWRYSQTPTMSSLLILLALADWSDDEGFCFPSHRAIAEKTGASRATVKRALREHIDRGELERVAKHGHAMPNPKEFIGRTGFRATNLYRLTLIDQLGSRRPELLARNRVTKSLVAEQSPELNWGQPETVTGVNDDALLGSTTSAYIRKRDPSEDTSDLKAGAAPLAPTQNDDETPDQNIGVITKVAHEIYDLFGSTRVDVGDVTEAVKSRCAQLHIAYTPGDVVRRAIDSAKWQRDHRQEAH